MSFTNILLDSRGRAKVADLGCSACAATWALPKTEKGTAHSRSPELWLVFGDQVAARGPASSQLVEVVATAVDCWSLGVCLGLLLTGHYGFQSFSQVVSCLGPLTDAEWMGCTSLPGYKAHKVAELSSIVDQDASVKSFFSTPQHVKYPKPRDDVGLDLVHMLLKWTPSSRCTAKQALDHNFFGKAIDLKEVIRNCTCNQLGELVLNSIRAGVAVSSVDLLGIAGATMVESRKRPHATTADSQEQAQRESPCKRPRADTADSQEQAMGKEPDMGQRGRACTTSEVAPGELVASEAAFALPAEDESRQTTNAETAGSQEQEEPRNRPHANTADSQEQTQDEELAADSQKQEQCEVESSGKSEGEATCSFHPLDANLCGCRGSCRRKTCMRICNRLAWIKK